MKYEEDVKCEEVAKVKRVSWNDDVKVHVYFLEEGETLGRMKVRREKHVKIDVPEEHQDLIQSVCGVDAVCNVYVAPKQVNKGQDADLLAALGML